MITAGPLTLGSNSFWDLLVHVSRTIRCKAGPGLERFGTTTAADGLQQMQRFIRPFWLSHALVLVFAGR